MSACGAVLTSEPGVDANRRHSYRPPHAARVASHRHVVGLDSNPGNGGQRPATTVEVLETYPAGKQVTLGRGENFYLRLSYDTDHPIGIWARPYFKGEPANAGNNGSYSYSGNGEARRALHLGAARPDRMAPALKWR
jgi:hypothetical protein